MGNVDSAHDVSGAWACASIRFRCLVRFTARIGLWLVIEFNSVVRASAR